MPQELKIEDDLFGTSEQEGLKELEEPQEEVKKAEPEEEPVNRADRRYQEKYQAEREANIQLNARLQAMAEIRKEEPQAQFEYVKNLEKIYGADSPEAQLATNYLKDSIVGAAQWAKEEALREFREERQREKELEAQEESNLNNMLDVLETQYGVDLTSSKAEATRQKFFRTLQRVSPKDENGNIIAYADPIATWEMMQIPKKENPAKELSAKSMNPTPASSGEEGDAFGKMLVERGFLSRN